MDKDQDEWGPLIRKISKDCRGCTDGVVYNRGGSASNCSSCVPRAKKVLLFKKSRIPYNQVNNDLDLKVRNSLMNRKLVYLHASDRNLGIQWGCTLLKDHCSSLQTSLYMELSDLIVDLKARHDRNLDRYQVIFLNNIDAYENVDQYILPNFDKVIMNIKTSNRKLILCGSDMQVGYSERVLNLLGVSSVHIEVL